MQWVPCLGWRSLVLVGAPSLLSGRLRGDVALLVLGFIVIFTVATHADHMERMRRVWGFFIGPIQRFVMAVLVDRFAMPMAYSYSRRACFGLDDFPYRPEVAVSTVPTFIEYEFYVHEEIEENVTVAVLADRQRWLDELVSRLPEVTGGRVGVDAVFRRIAGDRSLVHGAYIRAYASQ